MGRLVALLLAALAGTANAAWHFSDVTAEAGLSYQHGYVDGTFDEPSENAGGVAAGDYDGDGFIDLFVVRGDIGPNLLFRNRGDGTFEERGAAAGIALEGARSSGPLFADLDGDGWLDLFVGGVHGTLPRLYRNRGDGTFEDVTAASGLVLPPERETVGATAGDYDRDGDLDLFLTHWSASYFHLADDSSLHLWRNDGGMHFTDVTLAAGIAPASVMDHFESFTANFVDVDGDGWPDLLVAADYGTSRVYHNDGDGTFTDVTDRSVITDGNGMGAAIGDYDEDGDFDWFVSSIWDPNGFAEGAWDTTGNRLYRNRGDGTFEDATDAAGVRRGYWGWGATFEDLDDDGHLDLFHVNGFGDASIPQTVEFFADPARLFVGNGAGAFTEQAQAVGVADTGEGRGVVAFDYDRDGDLDLFVANNGGSPRLFRNDDPPGRSLTVALRGPSPNVQGIGAVIDVQVDGSTKRRLIRAGSNYVSQDPAEAHVGLGQAAVAERTDVRWLDGTITSVGPLPAGLAVLIDHGDAAAGSCGAGECTPAGTKRKTDCLLEWKLPGAAGRASRKRSTVTCTKGDRSCDAAPDPSDGQCRIAVDVCVNVADPRLPACGRQILSALRIDEPRVASSDPADAGNRAALLGVSHRLTSSVFANATPDLCVGPIELVVPLRRSRSGRLRSGTRRVRATAVTTTGGEDRDTIVLRCRPTSATTNPTLRSP